MLEQPLARRRRRRIACEARNREHALGARAWEQCEQKVRCQTSEAHALLRGGNACSRAASSYVAGGHGFSSLSGLPELVGDYAAQVAYEACNAIPRCIAAT